MNCNLELLCRGILTGVRVNALTIDWRLMVDAYLEIEQLALTSVVT